MMIQEKLLQFWDSIKHMDIAVALLVLVLFLLLTWLINVAFLMIGANFANIKGRSFGKAAQATLMNIILWSPIVSILTALNPLLGLVGFWLLPVFFVQWVYSCTFGKSVVACFLSFIASVIFVVFAIISIPVIFAFAVSS
jgi:hypothetical protein